MRLPGFTSIFIILILLPFPSAPARADGGYGIVFLIVELEALKITQASCDKTEPSTSKTNAAAWLSFEQRNQDFVRWYVPWLKTQSDPLLRRDSIQRTTPTNSIKCTDIPKRLADINLGLADEWPIIQKRINAGPPP